MVEWISLGVSVGALGISGALAWREIRARPDLSLYLDWVSGGPGPWQFRIVVENSGRARGTVRNVMLSRSADYDKAAAFEFLPHLDVLPLMLEGGDVLRLSIPLDPNAGDTSLQRGLLQQTFTHVILKDQDENLRAVAIPDARGR
jgi:hypothetical protein